MSKTVSRLYNQFQPEHYDLVIKLDKASMKFSGTVIITGQKMGRPSKRITFHQNGLTITGARIDRITKDGLQPVSVSRTNTQKTYDEVRVHTEENLRGGKYRVQLEFAGTITRQMNGIYPCYFELNGTQQMLLATQFESHHAREAFPCIDEPEAKARFDLTLHTDPDEAVIADTPIMQQQTQAGKLVTRFETTPVMSTYLLAFVTGNLGYKEAKTAAGTVIRTYATPNNVAFTDFALDMAVKCLDFYNDYFGTPYPLEKCDMIALPDFASGAMENWGCVTYREQCMLVDPANTSLPTKQYVAMVVAHELAHQWFGNLVTMRWWTDLWLNEGFASWIEYLAVDHIFPEWDMWTQFAVDEQQAAFKLDSLENTHPIEVPVRHPDEIRTIFDTISYAKGASVIHMLYNYLGPTAFRDGLRHYLKQHAYGNTDTVDLWQALETVSKKPVKEFMHAWTAQAGFPILSARVSERSVELHQEVFQVNRANITHTSQLVWPVPLLANDQSFPDELTTASETIGHASRQLQLNQQQSGFYRTIYDPTHLERLGHAVKAGDLDPLNRLSLLSDSFEASKAGYFDTVTALQLLTNYTAENNSVVWDGIAGNLGELKVVMGTDELRDQLKPYIRKLVAPQLKRLGWKPAKDESHLDSLLRTTILGLAAAADEPTVVDECLARFKAMKKSEDISPDLRGVIYGTVSRLGDTTDYEKLLKLHDQSSNSEERVVIASALTGFEQPELIKRSLDLIKQDTVRLQDVPYWVAYSFMNRHARLDTWQWLKQNWKWVETNLGTDLSFYRFPIYAARSFSDQKFLEDYDTFFSSVMTPALERSFKQGREMVQWHIDWKKRDYKAVLDFFSQT